MRNCLLNLAVILMLTGCSSLAQRAELAQQIAAPAHMQLKLLKTGAFTIFSYQRISAPGKPITVYIEGDGFAAAERNRISVNPTPKDPLALRLAALDPAENVVYLARPCQYTSFADDPQCTQRFWSVSRFAEPVVASMGLALDEVIEDSKSSEINLVGYSGGAAVAIILAARRNDVISIRTVAGNLDHEAIMAYHKVSPLVDSLNPADYAAGVSDIPQYHFSGADDRVVPPFIAARFAEKAQGKEGCVHVREVEGATHHAGWASTWPTLLALPLVCDGEAVSSTKKDRK